VRRVLACAAPAALAAALAGCGTTEKEGSVGDELSANGLKVTVDRVDRSPPRPRKDITGLSLPAPGKRLVGVHARACSDHGGALGPYDFGIESSEGDGRLKYPAKNYRDAFESIRDDCGEGWIVFEIPADAKPRRVKFGFEDTGSTMNEEDRVDAEFSWKVE
jgi:hypothetical protein